MRATGAAMTDLDLRSPPWAIDRPDAVAAERYFDRGFADLERDRLWPHAWQMACRLEELPNPGDFVEYTICDQSVVLVRLDADIVRGYHNACRHRATQLVTGSGTFGGAGIVCPFHGWRWGLDGTNSFVYAPHAFDPALLAPDEICLRQVRVEVWGACAWINLDPDAPPLLHALAPLPSLLDPLGLADMRVHWWKAVVLRANWKLAQEASPRGIPTSPRPIPSSLPRTSRAVRPGQPELLGLRGRSLELRAPGRRPGPQRCRGRGERGRRNHRVGPAALCSGLEAMTLERDLHVIEGLRHRPIPEGSTFREELVASLYAYAADAAIPLPPPDPAALARWGGMFFMFPNYFVLPQYGNALVYRSRPDGDDPESCLFELWSITIPAAGDAAPRPVRGGPFAADDSEHWPRIPMQDFSNIGRQQRGLAQPAA